MPDYSLMIVDDDDVDRYTVTRLLRSAEPDLQIHEATDGTAAIDFFRDLIATAAEPVPQFPAVVFLDINMPRMGGFEFLERFSELRAEHPHCASLIFVLMTSSIAEQDRDRELSYEFVKGYVQKMPTSGHELLEVVRDHLPKA